MYLLAIVKYYFLDDKSWKIFRKYLDNIMYVHM
jgi:hypothetical protein